ncbi:MAG: flagellar brake protein [Acidobacteria bacterium]|nr:flagellar brake protein [Acidobacteriota bacterium]
MTEPILEVNDLVQVAIAGDPRNRLLPSRVEGIGLDEITISWSAGRTESDPVAPGCDVTIYFVRDRTQFLLPGRVLEAVTHPLPVLVVSTSGPAEPVERRGDIRVHAFLPVVLAEKVVSFSEFKQSHELAPIRTTTTNLSAGGFTIRHDSPVAVGTLYDVSLELPLQTDPLVICARVAHCEPVVAAEESCYELGFSFVQMPERLRSGIVRYVFKSQIDRIDPDN